MCLLFSALTTSQINAAWTNPTTATDWETTRDTSDVTHRSRSRINHVSHNRRITTECVIHCRRTVASPRSRHVCTVSSLDEFSAVASRIIFSTAAVLAYCEVTCIASSHLPGTNPCFHSLTVSVILLWFNGCYERMNDEYDWFGDGSSFLSAVWQSHHKVAQGWVSRV